MLELGDDPKPLDELLSVELLLEKRDVKLGAKRLEVEPDKELLGTRLDAGPDSADAT